MLEELKLEFQKNKEAIFADYFTFLKFASISTDPAYKGEVEKCADFLKDYIEKEIGLTVEKWVSKGAPVLFATHCSPEPQAETLLIYCHYDVQPVDPLELWTTPPFEPAVRNGCVYARGALDDKGQCFYTLHALKAVLKRGSLSLNIKVLIEGEEESGSTALHHLLKEKKEELKADHVLIVDAGLEEEGKPAISLGVRGLVAMTVTVQGSKFDLHSGTHGGIVYNPNRALVELLASLHDKDGKVTIPHFYDDVRPMSAEERKEVALDFNEEHFKVHFEALATGMEKGVSPAEAAGTRPTLEINGISGGYAGAGFKTVIPAQAQAKISCRLVPNQSPEKIGQLVKAHLMKHVPGGMKITVDIYPGMGLPVRANPTSKIARTMAMSFSTVFEKSCKALLMGGSIPIAADLSHISGGEMIFVGVGLPEDQIHAPNEHFSLKRFEQGFLTIAYALPLLAKKEVRV